VTKFTVNLSFLKRHRDLYQTLASFFKAFEIFNNVLVINLVRLRLVLSVKNIKMECLFLLGLEKRCQSFVMITVTLKNFGSLRNFKRKTLLFWYFFRYKKQFLGPRIFWGTAFDIWYYEYSKVVPGIKNGVSRSLIKLFVN
jgi:hypothetical protein